MHHCSLWYIGLFLLLSINQVITARKRDKRMRKFKASWTELCQAEAQLGSPAQGGLILKSRFEEITVPSIVICQPSENFSIVARLSLPSYLFTTIHTHSQYSGSCILIWVKLDKYCCKQLRPVVDPKRLIQKLPTNPGHIRQVGSSHSATSKCNVEAPSRARKTL